MIKVFKKKIFDNISLISIIFIFLIAKIIIFIKCYHLAIWDEAVYLGMGKWIYSNGTSGIWEVIRPIGLPLILGPLWKLGLNYILSSQLTITLFSIGCIITTYLITKEIYNKKIAIVACLFFAINPVFFELSSQIMTEIPCLLMILISIYSLIKQRYYLAGLFSFLAFFFRYPSGLIIITINIILIYKFFIFDKHKNKALDYLKVLIKYNLTLLLGLGLFLIYNKILYNSYLDPILFASKHQSSIINNAHNMIQYLFFYPINIIKTNIFVLFILCAAFFGILRFRMKKIKSYYLWIPFLLFLFYFTIIPHKQIRFSILFIPFLTILFTSGIFYILAIFRKSKQRWITIFLLVGIILQIFYLTFINFQEIENTCYQTEPDFINNYYRFFEHNPIADFEPYPNLIINDNNDNNNYMNNDDDMNDDDYGDNNNLQILTADPVFAAYSDYKYIQYYNNITDAIQIFDQNYRDSDAIIYTNHSFPCKNADCFEKKSRLLKKINKYYNLSLNISVNGDVSQIYFKS